MCVLSDCECALSTLRLILDMSTNVFCLLGVKEALGLYLDQVPPSYPMHSIWATDRI